MNTTRKELSAREKELVQLLMSECETTGDIQEKLSPSRQNGQKKARKTREEE